MNGKTEMEQKMAEAAERIEQGDDQALYDLGVLCWQEEEYENAVPLFCKALLKGIAEVGNFMKQKAEENTNEKQRLDDEFFQDKRELNSAFPPHDMDYYQQRTNARKKILLRLDKELQAFTNLTELLSQFNG